MKFDEILGSRGNGEWFMEKLCHVLSQRKVEVHVK